MVEIMSDRTGSIAGDKFRFLDFLKHVALMDAARYTTVTREISARDIDVLHKAAASYGDSWKSRGGVGAFMMLARKWDRIENQLKRTDAPTKMDGAPSPAKYDIFEHIEADPRREGIIDDIRDLRTYLMLVEAEMLAQGVIEGFVAKEDSAKAPVRACQLPELRAQDLSISECEACGEIVAPQTDVCRRVAREERARAVADGGSQHAQE